MQLHELFTQSLPATTLRVTNSRQMRVVGCRADLRYPALHRDRLFAVGASVLALAMDLDLVEQRLVDHAYRARHRRDALVVVHQTHCLLSELNH